jgi:hypothetical protein
MSNMIKLEFLWVLLCRKVKANRGTGELELAINTVVTEQHVPYAITKLETYLYSTKTKR